MTTNPPSYLRLGGSGRLGDDRVRLLEAIDRHGSITAAGEAVGLSYRATWDAVRALNALFPKPLVKAQAGGRSGGGAGLTFEGMVALNLLRHVETEIALTLGALQQRLGAQPPAGGASPWGLVTKTSARNAFRGVVTAITEGAVSSEVALAISTDLEIRAAISGRSVESLGLTVGSKATALIKASFVSLAAGEGAPAVGRENRLSGRVTAREDGEAMSEIIVELADSKTLVATTSRRAGDRALFRVGDGVTALIEASHVILAVE